MNKKKDTIFLFLSGAVLFQLILELILLMETKSESYILKIINYFNFLSLIIMGIFLVLYINKNYSNKTHHDTMENFYNIIKTSSINYYFQQLFHNSIPALIIWMLLIVINNLKSGLIFFSGFGICSLL